MQSSEQHQDHQPAPRRGKSRGQSRDSVWDIPGFLPKTKVTTSFGNMPIEGLRVRDPVRVRSGAYRRVEWIDKIHVDADFLACFPDAFPVVLGANSIIRNSPPWDIHMSPVQKVIYPQEWARPTPKMAKDLLGRPGVRRSQDTNFTYYLFHCGQPEYVLIDEIWCHTTP